MADKSFKVSFTLDAADVSYFRGLFRKAKKAAQGQDKTAILAAAKQLIEDVRKSRKAPHFVLDAITTLEDLTQIIEDEDYRAPSSVVNQVVGALAYFGNPEDLIPDHIPVLGFLDDAIMIKFVEDEFNHELRAYRKFRKFRDGAEQRPWTPVARERLPKRLETQRAKLRAEVEKRKKADAAKGALGF